MRLPQSYLDIYGNLQRSLLTLQEMLTENRNVVSIRSPLDQVDLLFRLEILPMDGDGLDPAVQSLWRSLQTELYREFRLLNMDFRFLQTSKTPQLKTQRQQQAGDRLQKMLQYCHILLTDPPTGD